MAESSWPSPTYNSGAVSNPEYEKLNAHNGAGLLGDYTATALLFADSSGRQVKLRAFRYAHIRGYDWYSGDGDVTVAIAANTSGSTRIDRIVLRLDRDTWNIRSAVIAGTPGAGAPAFTQQIGTTGVYEISLGVVTVAHNASSLAAGDVVFHAMYYAPPAMIGSTASTPFTMHTAGTEYRGMMWYDSNTYTVRVHDLSDAKALMKFTDTDLVDGASVLSAGFLAVGNGVRYQTRNFWSWLQFDIQRTGANLGTGTSTVLMTLPGAYRPAMGFFMPVKLTSTTGSAARCYVNSTGQVTLDSLDGALNTNGYVSGAIGYPTTF